MSQTLLQYETVKDISRRFQVCKGTMREILGISESTQARYEKKMRFSSRRSPLTRVSDVPELINRLVLSPNQVINLTIESSEEEHFQTIGDRLLVRDLGYVNKI